MSILNFGRIMLSGHGRVKGSFKLCPDKVTWTNSVSDKTYTVTKDDMDSASWTSVRSGCTLKLGMKGDTTLRYTGFKQQDHGKFVKYLKDNYDQDLKSTKLSCRGGNWGSFDFDGNALAMTSEGKTVFELPLSEISQCALPTPNEVEIQFMEDQSSANVESLYQARLYVPPKKVKDDGAEETKDGEEEDERYNAEWLQQEIIDRAQIRNLTGDIITEFSEKVGTFLTPRGRYSIEMCATHLRMRGKTYDYQILYKHIARLFLLPKPDQTHVAFVISLSVPIQQGQQRYAHLVMQCKKTEYITSINLTEEQITEQYGANALQPEMQNELHKVLARCFKVLTGRKIYTVGRYESYHKDKCIKCALKSHDGWLYPLAKSFFFIHKPPTFITFDSIESAEFQRYSGAGNSGMTSKSFDLHIVTKPSGSFSGKAYTFTSIERNEYASISNFLSSKNIPIRNLQQHNPTYELSDGEDENDSDDSDFSAGGDDPDSSDADYDAQMSDESGAGSSSVSDSEDEKPKKKRKKKSQGTGKKKKKKKR